MQHNSDVGTLEAGGGIHLIMVEIAKIAPNLGLKLKNRGERHDTFVCLGVWTGGSFWQSEQSVLKWHTQSFCFIILLPHQVNFENVVEMYSLSIPSHLHLTLGLRLKRMSSDTWQSHIFTIILCSKSELHYPPLTLPKGVRGSMMHTAMWVTKQET